MEVMGWIGSAGRVATKVDLVPVWKILEGSDVGWVGVETSESPSLSQGS
jgi:hypothetical protein